MTSRTSAPIAIDMHSHYYGGLVDGLAKRSVRPTITTNADGRNVLNAMTASTVMSSGYTDLEARLAYMDAAGIATQLLTFPGALGVDVMSIEEALAIVRDYNDNLANICRGSGGRFAGLAGLPLADIARSCDEMKRVRHSLGLLGVILPGNYFLSVETAERLRPVLAAANEQGALVMIHPGLMPGENPPDPYRDHSILRASALNLQASLSHMALTIIVAGFLDDYPNLVEKIQESLKANDANGLERASHSLKGSVANFGAEPAYQAALELERIGRSNDLSNEPPIIAGALA